MRVLAIDPGFERLGIAIIEKEKGVEKLLFSTCFKTSANLPFAERLVLIHKEVATIIKKYSPERLAIETLFFTNNQKTAMQVAETRGVILEASASLGLKIFEYSPQQIKIAVTGYGKSTKEGVMSMTRKLIKIETDTKSDDELDAIAIGLTSLAIEK